MKYFIFFILLSTLGYSQEVEDIIKTRKFVLEANKVTDEQGMAKTTVRRQCFVLIDSTKAIVQWVSEFDNNGLGGITLGGDILEFEHTINNLNKETLHSLKMTCEMDQGRVKSKLVIKIYSKSHAEARLENTSASIFLPKEINFLGKIVPFESSKVVIGAH